MSDEYVDLEKLVYVPPADQIRVGTPPKVAKRRQLANGMLKIDGVSRASKWRALAELERRGLISIERRSRKSPLITVNKHASDLKQWPSRN